MIRYVDMFKDQFGVEAICRTMRATECGFMSARGYRAAKSSPPSARALQDQLLGGEVLRLHTENYGVYGVRKMHALMRQQGWALGRDQTGRIMRSLGRAGVKRSKRVFTTKSDPVGVKPKDLVQRRFTAAAPCRLWVMDVTYVRTWQGFAYVAFVTDVFARKIVGFNVIRSPGIRVTETFSGSLNGGPLWHGRPRLSSNRPRARFPDGRLR